MPFLVRAKNVADDAEWYGGLTAHVPMDPLYVFYDGISNLAVGIDVDRDRVAASASVSDWPDLLKPGDGKASSASIIRAGRQI